MNDTQQRMTQLSFKLKTREPWLVGIESTVYLVVLLTALLGNILLTVAFYKTRTLRKPENYYLISLAATDILHSVVCMSLTLVVLIQGTWPFGDFLCQLQGSLISICATVSFFTLALIAINRYVKIVKSASLYQRVFSTRNIFLSIVICWIFVAFVTLVTFSFHGTVFLFHTGKGFCWVELYFTDSMGIYSACIYTFNISLGYSSTFFSYYKVFKKIRAHFNQVAGSSLHSDSSTAFAEEVRVTVMLFVTLVAYLICFIPSNIMDLYEVVGGYYTLPRQAYFFSSFTLASGSAINPLIYGLMKREFRDAYKGVLSCKKV
ncbi:hypothetical protein ACROYT_G024044 [Oculina patagonica]